MKRSIVFNLKNIQIYESLKKNKMLLVLCLLFALGVLLGTLSYSKSDVARKLSESGINSFLLQRQGKSFLSKMFSSSLEALAGILISFVFGTSPMGIITVPAFICCCGFGYGAVSSLLYSKYALKGIAFNGMLILPPLLLLLIALILAAREAISFSVVISRLMLPRSRPMNLSYDFKNYCGRFLLITLSVIFVAFIDAVLSSSFLRFFNL